MSHEKVRSISVTKEGVVKITAADSSIRPLTYRKLVINEGKELAEREIWKKIIINFRDGNFHVSGSTPILRAIKQGMNNLERYGYLQDNNYAEYIYGLIKGLPNYILEASLKAFADYGRSEEYLMLSLQESPERWNYISDKMRKNKVLAKKYVELCAGRLLFYFPSVLADDMEVVEYCLEKDGCEFRHMSVDVRNNKSLAKVAFGTKNRPEHLPDILGPMLLMDVEFLCELIALQPHLHYDRMDSVLLENSEIIDALTKYNEFYQRRNNIVKG